MTHMPADPPRDDAVSPDESGSIDSSLTGADEHLLRTVDEGLRQLADCYQALKPPVGALDRLHERLARDAALGDDDLDWLAAAGPGIPRLDDEDR